jgi:hypothetical protein
VSLYLWEHYRVQHELDSVLIVRMYDSEEQTFEQIEALVSRNAVILTRFAADKC